MPKAKRRNRNPGAGVVTPTNGNTPTNRMTPHFEQTAAKGAAGKIGIPAALEAETAAILEHLAGARVAASVTGTPSTHLSRTLANLAAIKKLIGIAPGAAAQKMAGGTTRKRGRPRTTTQQAGAMQPEFA